MEHASIATDGPHLVTWESEIRALAGLASTAGELETGGELFGSCSRDGQMVIELVTPPSPLARHEPTHFRQDLETFLRRRDAMSQRAGRLIDGTWHSHAHLGLDRPSGGDLRKVRSITGKLGAARWSEIIVTLEERVPVIHDAALRGFHTARWIDPCYVRLNSFVYTAPGEGKYVRCPIRVLAGVSPLRRGLSGTDILSDDDFAAWALAFPAEWVRYDSIDALPPNPTDRRVFEVLTLQIQKLPPSVSSVVEIRKLDGLVLVAIPLDQLKQLHVIYKPTEPDRPICVLLRDYTAHHTTDLSARCAEEHENTLGGIWSFLQRLSPSVTTAENGDSGLRLSGAKRTRRASDDVLD